MQPAHHWRRPLHPILTLLLLAGVLLGGSACWPLPDASPGAAPTAPAGTTPTPGPSTTTAATTAPPPAAIMPTFTAPPVPPPGTPGTNEDQQLTMIGGADDPPTLDPALASDSQS